MHCKNYIERELTYLESSYDAEYNGTHFNWETARGNVMYFYCYCVTDSVVKAKAICQPICVTLITQSMIQQLSYISLWNITVELCLYIVCDKIMTLLCTRYKDVTETILMKQSSQNHYL